MEFDSKKNKTYNNKYKTLKKIGFGGFSNVYLIEDQANNNHYALKIIKKITHSFKKEISIHEKVSLIKNPYIINLIDYGKVSIKSTQRPLENKHFAILEYAPKGELYEYIFNTINGLREKYAKLIFRKILEGVQAFHNLGICHRDLKLQNILMDEFFIPKICDFGFATEILEKDGSDKLNEFVGTKSSAAPEILLSKPYSGIKVDIFSLGVILINLVTKSFGFINAHESDNYYNYIINGEYNLYWKAVKGQIREISDELKNLYLKMVSFNPDERPNIEEILNDPWMKEINDLNENEYKRLEVEVYKEFKKLENIIENKNNKRNNIF